MKNHILMSLLVVLFGCYDYEDWNAKRDYTLYPKVRYLNLPDVKANGVDSLNIEVQFPLDANRKLLKVNFKTDGGVFIQSQKPEFTSDFYVRVDDHLVITAILRVPADLKPHVISVDVPGVVLSNNVLVFQRSFPKTIKVEPSKFSLAGTFSDELTLTATLKANVGLPSEGTEVTFVVSDTLESNNERHFRNLKFTDAEGKASVNFSFGSVNKYRGSIPIKVLSKNGAGEVISDIAYIEIVEPK